MALESQRCFPRLEVERDDDLPTTHYRIRHTKTVFVTNPVSDGSPYGRRIAKFLRGLPGEMFETRQTASNDRVPAKKAV
jgi:hypothetical protein